MMKPHSAILALAFLIFNFTFAQAANVVVTITDYQDQPLTNTRCIATCYSVPSAQVGSVSVIAKNSFYTDDFDARYGSRWQGYVQQTMTDLFWQEPHIPCGLDAAWTMDNGSCQTDTDTEHYYALAPMVEARLTLPDNYGAGADETPPALPSGIVIGWLSPVDNTGSDVAYPPGFIGFNVDGSPASRSTAWVVHSLLCAAIAPDSSCRFEGDYENQVIDCA